MALVNNISCSFCGKDQKSVGKLIAGQTDVFICNECVDICNEVLAPPKTNTGQPHFEIIEQNMFCALLYNYDWRIIENMQDWFRENDIRVWLRTHTNAGMTTPVEDVFKIIFETESDLIAFKLRWI